MSNKNIDSEILNKYIESKQNIINNLDNNRLLLEEEINRKKEEINRNKQILQKQKFKKSLLKDQYNSLLRILKERGVIIYIKDNNYSIREWDNLYIKKEKNKNFIVSKNGNVLNELDERISKVFSKEISSGDYRLVVTRVENKKIKIQFFIGNDK
ncbi:hypothetical protein [Clostridium ganghwense]|uniref:Uncharacterized protein n=1 Tax=Clostridium ganghwense TaxID=312089 RepID=A0ABT4CS99_9CLOT|nr:hypothetical protein [Clostridium ganghwense]MCY6371944.1 hypothetical protein [Clostridium ganghwense]